MNKLLLIFSLLSISFMSYADTKVQYTLYNQSSTPYNVTFGGISYYITIWDPSYTLPTGCPTYDHQALADMPLPFPIPAGSSNTFTFVLPATMDYCFANPTTYAAIDLHIKQMDGMSKGGAPDCTIPTDTWSAQNEHKYVSVSIIEDEKNQKFACFIGQYK